MANENRRKLYDALNSAGFDIGNYDDFDRRMNTAADRNSFYNAVSERYDIGSREDFERRIKDSKYKLTIGGTQRNVSEKEYKDYLKRHPKPVNNAQRERAGNGGGAGTGGKMQMPQGFGGFNPDAGMPSYLQEGQKQQREEGYGTMEEQQRINDVFAALKGDKEAMQRAGLDRMARQLQDRYEYASATGKELKDDVLDMTHLGYAPTVVRDENGELVRNENGEVIKGMVKDDVRANTQAYEQERVRRENIQRQIDEATKEMEDINERLKEFESRGSSFNINPHGSPSFDYSLMSGDAAALTAAYKQAQERIRALEIEKTGGEHGFIRGLINTAKDPSTWLLGIDKLQDNATVLAVSEKMKRGEDLSDAEKEMLGSMLKTQQVEGRLQEGSDWQYRAGAMTTQMLPFMLQIAMTDGFGSVAAIGEGAGKRLAEKYAQQFGTDALLNRINANIIKGIGIGLGDVAAGFVSANTTGIGNTINDAIERRIGQLGINEDGDYEFEGGEDMWRAIMKAEVSQTKEFATERFGEHLPGLREMNVWFAKTGTGARKIARALSGFAGTKAMQKTADFLRKGGINGLAGEIIEEEIGLPIDVAIGDMTWEEALSGETQWDIVGGMIMSMGAMHAVGAVAQGLGKTYNTAQYYRYKHRADVADLKAWAIVGSWDDYLKDEIDATKTEDMNDLWERIRQDETLEDNQKRAIFDYINALTLERGYNQGMFFSAKEAAKNPALAVNVKPTTADEQVEIDLMGSSDAGYNITDPQAMNDAKNTYEYQQTQLEIQFGDETAAVQTQLDRDPVGTLGRMTDIYTEEQKRAAFDYVNAKATYEGMIDRVRDDIEAQIEESDRRVDERVNQTTGMIHPATLAIDGRQVYIVDGDIVMTGDGGIVDAELSSESFLYRDAETGKLDWCGPRDILTVDDAINAEEEKEQARQLIRDTVAQAEADKIDGVLSFNVGDNYSFLTESGLPMNFTILADNGDGTVMVAINGQPEQEPYTKDALQYLADNTNMQRLQEQLAEKAIADGEASGTVAKEYNLDDEVALHLADGRTVRGQVSAEEDADGMIEIYAEEPVDGSRFLRYSREELDALTAENTEADASGTVATSETVEGDADAPNTATVEPMPMNGEEPDFMAVTPARAYQYIYEESGLEAEVADAFVQNNVVASQKALDKLQEKKPKIGTSIAKFNKEKAEWQGKVDAARAENEQWRQIKAERAGVIAEINNERAEQERAVIEKAKAEEEAFRAEQEKKAQESAELGSNAVAPAISEKWQNAKKIEGAEDEIVLANGEKVAGRYMLVESGVATPSHDATNGFVKSEGFPVDENGGSVNDRDYERDKDAQQVTRDIAANYDSRAVQTPVVVSQDGVVLSGNGRTMAGELAAQQGTDGAYIEYVATHPSRWGFTEDQVRGMKHPRVQFVPYAAMPYTAETFAKFNQQEMKSQSKTEQAVKLGKVVSDGAFNRIIKIINGFDTLGDFYADQKATAEAVTELQNDGVITQVQFAEMFDGEGISAVGKELLENMLIGKAFESNPNAVREISEFKSMRQSIITALAEISNNLALGTDYSLESELAQAIDLVYQARKQVENFADSVRWQLQKVSAEKEKLSADTLRLLGGVRLWQ